MPAASPPSEGRSLRVLHVLTYTSPSGDFGGPASVAHDQAEVLRRRGHQVTIVAMGPHRHSEPGRAEVFPARTVSRRIGFAGLTSPGMLAWVARHVRSFDLVHVHLARDLATLPAALLALLLRVPYVVQPHAMVDRSDRRSAAVLDVLATRRVLRRAGRVLGLTAREGADVAEVAGPVAFSVLGNGVATLSDAVPREPDVAVTQPVLFVGRLHPRKRPVLFVEAAARAVARGVPNAFAVYGADEGELPAVREAVARHGLEDRVALRGPVSRERVLEAVAEASLLVVPTAHEAFGMAIVEAMSAGTPVVCLSDCGLAPAIATAGAGAVSGDHPDEIAAAVAGLLEPARWGPAAAAARRLVSEDLTLDAVADRLEVAYASCLARSA